MLSLQRSVLAALLLPAAFASPLAPPLVHSFRGGRGARQAQTASAGSVQGGASQSFAVGSREAQQQAQLAATQGSVGAATDGSNIVAMTMSAQNIAVQFKVSAPANTLLAAAQNGATLEPAAASSSAKGTNGTITGNTEKAQSQLSTGAGAAGRTKVRVSKASRQALPGINVLLHGDGGTSFFDFPNQAVQDNLMGVVALAPNDQMFWGGGAGLQRTDGALHSQLINTMITQVLPQVMQFDQSRVFFTGVSGGSLMLSGFFLPMFAETFSTAASPTGALLNCGGLAPQVAPSANFGATLASMRVHFQSTSQELSSLQTSIPGSITEYAQAAQAAGASADQVNAQITADATPEGGHCEFDGKDFVSGVQLMADNFANVVQAGATGQVDGIGNVLVGVLDNNQQYASGVPLATASQNTVTQVAL